MSSAEKELEEKLLEIGKRLLSPPSDVNELIPLLDKAETFLSRVEQSPSESMSAALHPAMKGLISKEILGHPDADVRLAVTACISEITRITAPEAPYNDDLMKEIFQMIVKAFENLNDVSSRSYSKRVLILETVAKVRSCVVMLDLECDTLILEMFRHFLRTIRDNHSENVFSSMEVIMTLVLEESEDISPALLSLLLTSVKKDNMDILPVARRLAEKVIVNCTIKLKSCLMDAVQSLGAPLNDYSTVVATVCQENSNVSERNRLNASAECLADDSRFSERTVSDELAQGSGKMESEVSCPEVGTGSVRSPKSVMSNGNLQARNDGSVVETASLNKKTDRHAVLPRNASGAAEAGVQIPNRRKGRSSEFDQSESGHPSRKETETGIRGKHRRSSNEKLPSASQPKHSHGKMKIHVSGDAGVPLKKRGRKPRVDVSDDTPITELVSKIKKQRGRVSNSDKETFSSPKTATKSDVDQNVMDENIKSKSGRKRARDEGGRELEYDESLVGARIKVWWPDDAKFYPGVVVSYNPNSKKHKVLYSDGDKETLLLRNERFELIGGAGKEEENSSTPEAASKPPRKRKRDADATSSASGRRRGGGGEEAGGSSLKPGRRPGTPGPAATPKSEPSSQSTPRPGKKGSASGTLQGGEERSGKKRRKKPQD